MREKFLHTISEQNSTKSQTLPCTTHSIEQKKIFFSISSNGIHEWTIEEANL